MLTALLACMALSMMPPAEMPVQLHECGVFLTQAERAHAAERAERLPWAVAAKADLLAEADALVEARLDIPAQGGQWDNYYFCEDDAAPLEARSPTEHVCTECGRVYSGWPYDLVYVANRHRHWIQGLEVLGSAYVLTQDERYAERTRAALLEYARIYEDLPLRDRYGKRKINAARLFPQTLDEAIALCSFALGYDLVRPATCFREKDRQRIAEDLLRPMVRVIRASGKGVSNWQAWHNAGVACAGYVLSDKTLVERAINGRHGACYQLRRSLYGSGMWYEGAPMYHFYALRAFVYLFEAAQRAGTDFYALEGVRGMFTAPLDLALPGGMLPPLHDSLHVPLSDYRPLYEAAYAHYGDPRFAGILRRRRGPWALLWGADNAEPKAGPVPRLSTIDRYAGIAVLRDEATNTAAVFDFGLGLSDHAHKAYLGLMLYRGSESILLDPGRVHYAHPLQDSWYRRTLAHNTLVIGGEDHRHARPKLLDFQQGPDYTLVRARVEDAYPGVTFERTVVLWRGALVDVLRATSEKEQTFTLPMHLSRELEATETISVPAPEGFDMLRRPRLLEGDRHEIPLGTGRDRLDCSFSGPGKTFVATGTGSNPSEETTVLLRVIHGREAHFGLVLGGRISALRTGRYRVQTAGASSVLRVGPDTAFAPQPNG